MRGISKGAVYHRWCKRCNQKFQAYPKTKPRFCEKCVKKPGTYIRNLKNCQKRGYFSQFDEWCNRHGITKKDLKQYREEWNSN